MPKAFLSDVNTSPRIRDLPKNWASFICQRKVNAGGVPSEDVVHRLSRGLAYIAYQGPAQRALREKASASRTSAA